MSLGHIDHIDSNSGTTIMMLETNECYGYGILWWSDYPQLENPEIQQEYHVRQLQMLTPWYKPTPSNIYCIQKHTYMSQM